MRALLLVILPLFPAAAHAQLPEPIAKGIKNPESVVVGGDNRLITGTKSSAADVRDGTAGGCSPGTAAWFTSMAAFPV